MQSDWELEKFKFVLDREDWDTAPTVSSNTGEAVPQKRGKSLVCRILRNCTVMTYVNVKKYFSVILKKLHKSLSCPQVVGILRTAASKQTLSATIVKWDSLKYALRAVFFHPVPSRYLTLFPFISSGSLHNLLALLSPSTIHTMLSVLLFFS